MRVSTQEQKENGLSVINQITALEQWCKDNGCESIGIYNDAGISAHKSYTKRPALLKLIDDCKAGKVDLIIFTKLDRWFRSVGDYYEVQRQLDECKVPWRAIWEDYETETSAGVFKVNIMLSIAQAEAERTSERIKAVLEYKRSEGHFIGNAPLGYKKVNQRLVIDEDIQDIVKGMFDVYFSTHSSSACMQYLRKHNIERTANNIRRAIRNPIYCGNAQGNKCPAYITKEQHDLIITIFEENTFPKDTRYEYLFNSMCRCGICGKSMRSKHHKFNYKEKSYHMNNYVCEENADKHSINLSENKIEKYLLAEIENIIGAYNIEAEASAENRDNAEVAKRMMALEEKQKRIGIRFEDGYISESEYRQKMDAIKKELSELNFVEAPTPVELPSNWYDIYQQLDIPHRHQFWMSIIKNIIINEDKSISVIFF